MRVSACFRRRVPFWWSLNSDRDRDDYDTQKMVARRTLSFVLAAFLAVAALALLTQFGRHAWRGGGRRRRPRPGTTSDDQQQTTAPPPPATPIDASTSPLIPLPPVDERSSPLIVTPVSYKRPLNVVFCFDYRPVDDGGRIFETTWIQTQLFGQHLGRPVRSYSTHFNRPGQSQHPPLMNDTVYVFLFGPAPGDIFTKLKQGGYVNFGGLHMGDESGEWDTGFYRTKETWFNFRNYWKRDYFTRDALQAYHREYRSPLMYVPLGVKTGLHMSDTIPVLPASRRQYTCNFIGSLRANRAEMLNQLGDHRGSCFISSDKPWADPNNIHILIYRDIVQDSAFTLAPFGNNEESLRFYESLEMGSIPIAQVSRTHMGDFIEDGLHGLGRTWFPLGDEAMHFDQDDDLAQQYKDLDIDQRYDFIRRPCPIPRVREWTEVQDLLTYFRKHPEHLDGLQRRVMRWWARTKRRFQLGIKQVVDDGFQRAHGEGAADD